jgi:MoaA/NifB/PqqE/SkfB family radical SAM enzyme
MACEGRRFRVVQIHPSLRCNLACRHCYSLSGPLREEALPLETVLQLIVDLPGLGFNAISLSGGEPLMWQGLGPALATARKAGLITALTTNLMPLTPERLAILRVNLNFCAVSLDGVPASHDAIRGRKGAFSVMQSRLTELRASSIPFGFIFTLTEANIQELAWVARFAVEQGASLLQVHPLEEAGRAASEMAGARPSELIANAAYLACLRLQEALGDRLPVQLDLAHRGALAREPWRAFGTTADTDSALLLADLIDTLVIEADGTVSPVQHGFDRALALGNLVEAPLPVLASRWRARGGPARLRARCAAAAARAIAEPHDLPAFNWHEALAAA